MNFAWRIYRRLAQAFPHEFKLAYGTEVMQLGEDVVDDIAKRYGTDEVSSIQRASRVKALPQSWKAYFQQRLQEVGRG